MKSNYYLYVEKTRCSLGLRDSQRHVIQDDQMLSLKSYCDATS